MKQEDFERLKDKLGDEFEIIQDALVSIDGTIAFVRKKDIWDGVEFAESNWSGKIFKTDQLIGSEFDKNHLKPSTESDYIEQLKKEAHERFGEIRHGDIFHHASGAKTFASLQSNEEWDYIKDEDQLFYYNLEVYARGKWAERVKERVEVDIDQKCWAIISKGKQEIELTFLISKPVPCIEAMKTFLASQLEKYLNGEIE